jgi:7-cyano-7-deazaguanine synthase
LRERICVLASGGLDSAVLIGLLAARHEVHPLYVRCGLAWEHAEEALLASFLGSLRTANRRGIASLVRLELPVAPLYGAAHWSISRRDVPGARAALASNYLPGRNLLLGSLAAVHCARAGIPTIALALLADNPFPDATPAFLAGLGRIVSRALATPLAIRAPFRRLHKQDVIRRGRHLPLGLTLSCARPRGLRHCGRCTKCTERRRAFARAGVPDPTEYASRRAGEGA